MRKWKEVKRDLQAAGYRGFEFDSGETVIPELRGKWVVGKITPKDHFDGEDQSLWQQLTSLLGGSNVVACAGPADVPDPIRIIADRYDLNVVIVSVSSEYIRIALCEPPENSLPS